MPEYDSDEDTLPTENKFSDWEPYFTKIGIDADFLKTTFEAWPKPDLAQLYAACNRYKDWLYKDSPRNFYNHPFFLTEAWQLHALSRLTASRFLKPHHRHHRDKYHINIMHLAALSGSRVSIHAASKLFPELLDSNDANDNNMLHFAAYSGSPDAIKIVFKLCPELAESRDKNGRHFLHFAAKSGSPEAIKMALKLCQRLKFRVDNNGCNFIHFAALSGSPSAMETVLDIPDGPSIEYSRSKTHTNILHYAALSGSPAAIELALFRCHKLHQSEDDSDCRVSHYAAKSGSSAAIEKVLLYLPELKECRNRAGDTILHYAASSGSPEAIKTVIKLCPQLKDEKNLRDTTFLHIAAHSGSPAAIETALALCPELKTKRCKLGNLFPHYAAWSGSIPAIEAVLKHYPKLSKCKNKHGSNMLHYIGTSGSVECFTWMLKNHPKLAARMWMEDKNGKSPDSYGVERKMTPSPQNILHNLFIEALQALARRKNLPTWIPQFVLAFQDKLVQYLQSNPDIHTAILNRLIKQNKLPPVIMTELKFLKLAKYNTQQTLGNKLDRAVLNAVLAGSEGTLKMMNQTPSQFFYTLKKIAARAHFLPDNELDDVFIRMIKIAIDDHQRKHKKSNRCIDCNIAGALLRTTNLERLVPKKADTLGIDISARTFRNHYLTIQSTVQSLALRNEIRSIMSSTMLPGILHIIEYEDSIVRHVTKNYGVLYYVSSRLPLHTDHSTTRNPQEYRATLRRLLENLFGSFYIADRAGQLTEWCNRLCDGFCFEGRIKNTFDWITGYSDMMAFEDLMSIIHAEYQVYEKIISGKTINEIGHLNEALHFIMQRYKNQPCLPDKEYAPKLKVTRSGVKKFLNTVLEYGDESLAVNGKHAPYLSLLDNFIAHSNNNAQCEAMLALRFAIVNAPDNQPIQEIIKLWKETTHPVSGKCYAVTIAEDNRPAKFLTFFRRVEKTDAEETIAELVSIADEIKVDNVNSFR